MKKFLLIILGIIAGIINGMFSTGAGMILVPSYIYLLKKDEYTSRCTSIFVILIFCVINIIIYSKSIMFRFLYLPIILSSIIGTVIGMKLVYKINKDILSVIFAIFTIIMGIGMIYKWVFYMELYQV